MAGLVGDPAALGGAVTTALCGHWEHDGPCRWEHFTDSRPEGDEVVVTVYFEAGVEDEEQVRRLVRDALAVGSLVGPDGTTTTWRLLD
ncbi:hypothetical protein SAMN04489867_1942 [Pedococcus dokdonensis]|uniref:Uncharacterized protein n=1 Tax=Pedococcus dokdonensis TaxID=443156 RepID=A0A1H0RH29_9MICO|nr:hypothetical protein SAMN04489867_1942 [Pedococcus dokdonensis]